MSASKDLLLVYKDAVISKEEKKNHHPHLLHHHHHRHRHRQHHLQQQKEVAEEELVEPPSPPQRFLLRKPLAVQKSSPNISNGTAAIAATAITALQKKPSSGLLPKPPSPAAKRAVSSTASRAPPPTVSPVSSELSADVVHGVSSPVSAATPPSRLPPVSCNPSSVSSPALNAVSSPSTPAFPASLCSDCRRAAASASSNGAVCFIGNNGRVSACSVRSAITLCKNLQCAANNPAYVAAMSTIAPKKYLISKRHQLPSYALKNPKLKSPSPSPSSQHDLELQKNSHGGGSHHTKNLPAHSPCHDSSLSEQNKDMSRSVSMPLGSEEDSLSCDMESLHLVSNGDPSIEEKKDDTMPHNNEMVLPPSESLNPLTKECLRDNAGCLVESSFNVRDDCLPQLTDENEDDHDDLMLDSAEIISSLDEYTNDADDSDSHDCERLSNETVLSSGGIDPCVDAYSDRIDSGCDGCLSEEFAIGNGNIVPSNIVEDLSMVNGGIVPSHVEASNEKEHVHTEDLNTVIDDIMSSHVETSDESEYVDADALTMVNGATKHNLGDQHNFEGRSHDCDDVNGHANGSHDCDDVNGHANGSHDCDDVNGHANGSHDCDDMNGHANGSHDCDHVNGHANGSHACVDSNGRRLQRRSTRVLDVIEDSNPESVTLRKQKALERKAAEEWMLNHAIEGVVHKLAPTGKAKVKILVKAFESVISHQGLVETPNQS